MISKNGLLHRRAVVAELLRERGDLLVIAGLGAPNWDVTAAGDHPNTFPLWGAMGSAAMIGLGLALAKPNARVAVITGDGEMLMGLGSLATIGVQKPNNLAIVVFDNGLYGETGRQRSHTALGTDLVTVAGGCGIADALRDPGPEDLAERIRARRATTFALVRVEQDEPPRALPPRDGVANKNAFRAALGLPTF